MVLPVGHSSSQLPWLADGTDGMLLKDLASLAPLFLQEAQVSQLAGVVVGQIRCHACPLCHVRGRNGSGKQRQESGVLPQSAGGGGVGDGQMGGKVSHAAQSEPHGFSGPGRRLKAPTCRPCPVNLPA